MRIFTVLVFMAAAAALGQTARLGDLGPDSTVVTNAVAGGVVVESDPLAYPVATNALALAEGALQPDATNGLPVAVAHAQSAHGLTDNGGFAGGDGASATHGGAVGRVASATYGGAVGSGAFTTTGGAVGSGVSTTTGGAVGAGARATNGGAVGAGAMTSSGFAGGYRAFAALDDTGFGTPIDAIQLGTGWNPDANTLQIYGHKLLNADGSIPAERMAATLSGYATVTAVAAVSSWVESIRGVHADIATNITYHVVVSNGHWLIREGN